MVYLRYRQQSFSYFSKFMMSDQNGTNDSHPILEYESKHILVGEETRLMFHVKYHTVVFLLCLIVRVLLYRLLSGTQFKRRTLFETRHITATLIFLCTSGKRMATNFTVAGRTTFFPRNWRP